VVVKKEVVTGDGVGTVGIVVGAAGIVKVVVMGLVGPTVGAVES
jgi:hypothetical protein